MDNPFFTALEAGSAFKASELAASADRTLLPFMRYLNNSIESLENKEVSCHWKPVANSRYALLPTRRIYQLIPVSEIELLRDEQGWYEILCEMDGSPLDNGFTPNPDDAVFIGKGADRRRFELEPEQFRPECGAYRIYLPDVADAELISWSGYQLRVRPLSVSLDGIGHIHIDGNDCQVMRISGNRLQVRGYVAASSRLTIHGQNTRFRLISGLDTHTLEDYQPIRKANGWRLLADHLPTLAPHQIEDITARELSQLACEHLLESDKPLSSSDWILSVEEDRLILSARAQASLAHQRRLQCSRLSGLAFAVEEQPVKEKWIQLLEKDDADDTGRSTLDAFFTDNIKILDSTQSKRDEGFRVLKTRPEERQLLLARDTRGKRSWQSEYPSTQGKQNEIRVSVDTSQLKRQKDAINHLKNRPALGHLPLIHLLQNRNKAHWHAFSPAVEQRIHWRVLTNPAFEGCDRQREFVCKALATPDFALLDGPPGTGKTTSILELIIQLVLQGKRVLLSASTHAAINNVLERIQDNPALSAHIFPLRIGDESNAIGVEQYQYDNLFEQLRQGSHCDGFSRQLLVDSANLVCGTTIGILRLFNERDLVLDRGAPPFDVMIIDECSKTTFQEFLVPARFARRWVLVGDVRQLSPFTDREQIVANLDRLMLRHHRRAEKIEYLAPAVQQACFLLETLRGEHHKPYSVPLVMPVSDSVIRALAAEIAARSESAEYKTGLSNILLIGSQGGQAEGIQVPEAIVASPWLLYQHNLCFVSDRCMAQLQDCLPTDAIVLDPVWPRTAGAFAHAASQLSKPSFRMKTGTLSDASAIHEAVLEHLASSKWSKEVCWRLEREYWLRLSENHESKTRHYSATLGRLFPKSADADERIHNLKNIAFPSILEALSGNGLIKRKNDDATTLNRGFLPEEKEARHTRLTYQHRMHPDISAFPREQFYRGGSLHDGGKVCGNRAWDYRRYPARNAWLDVRGKTQRNANLREVELIIRELEAFCDWAQGKSKAGGSEPYDVAILTFYKGQEKALREALQKLPGNGNRYARFHHRGIAIKLATVDYFQGQEADLVFLSMVNTEKDGFMDSPNRLNVAITRARYQLVMVGSYAYFVGDYASVRKVSRTEELKKLAGSCQRVSAPSHQEKRKHG